jgi:RNA polymerase sigma factor (sigma-70 family)
MGDISRDQAESIYKELSSYVFRVALFLTKSKTLADDITQETFLQVFKKYDSYDPSKSIKPWIYKITLNITRNTIRKQKWLGLFSETPEKDSIDLVEGSILKNEEEEELWKEINKLSSKCKEIIVLHYYSDMKLNEVSSTLGIPLGTCKSRLNTALTSLKKHLAKSNFNISFEGGNVYESI